jgi:hypothetical protein
MKIAFKKCMFRRSIKWAVDEELNFKIKEILFVSSMEAEPFV